jgi:hypothetical protein
MSSKDYVGVVQRSFKSAVVHLLETSYGLLGSQRVLSLLADDLQTLVEQFYPVPEHVPSGWMVFVGTKATGPKAYPGQSAGDFELVTLAWPVLVSSDLERLASLPPGPAGAPGLQALLEERLIRLIEHGCHHPQGPVLLTRADLAALLGLTPPRVSALLIHARQTTHKALLTKGYYFDQGMRPTHKAETIALYEAGVDELTIARQIGHAQTSVGHYIRDYERVKLLLTHHTPIERIPVLIGMQPNVVRAHADLVYDHHPELMPEGLAPPAT